MVLLRTLSFFLFPLFLLASCVLTPLQFDEGQWRETVEGTNVNDIYASNNKDGSFFNPWLPEKKLNFYRFLRWRFSRSPDYTQEARENRPVYIPGLLDIISTLPPEMEFIAWIGHATFLMRLGDEYWFTDPLFTDRALLPKRVSQSAIPLNQVSRLRGKINVVISHNHYDHLDADSLRSFPKDTTYFVPLGLKKYVDSIVAGKVIELNWWQSFKANQTTILTCLPAQHWSRRLFQGYNETLWASFMIESGTLSIYFGGDSGYFKGYREIKKNLI